MESVDYRDAPEVVTSRVLLFAGVICVSLAKVLQVLTGWGAAWPFSAAVALSLALGTVLTRERRVGCEFGVDGLVVNSWLRSRSIAHDQLRYVVSTRFDAVPMVEWASVVLVYRNAAGVEQRIRLCGSMDDSRAANAAERLHGALPEAVQTRVRLVFHHHGHSTLRYLNPGQ